MASEKQPPSLSARPTTHGDIEEEVPPTTAKSAEDRKAASALASLDSAADTATTSTGMVDKEALSKAMRSGPSTSAKTTPQQQQIRNVKVDPADVVLLVDELEVTKPKATEMLKAGGGDVSKVLREFVTA